MTSNINGSVPIKALTRLQKEIVNMKQNPKPYIKAAPEENNILNWHYVLTGPPDTVFAGGEYHGLLKFPKEYPFKPPSILMITPNGRFKTNQRICLTMSDFHPDSWSPAWNVSTILTGLLSFMLDTKELSHVGALASSDGERRRFAAESMAFNRKDAIFRELFLNYDDEDIGKKEEEKKDDDEVRSVTPPLATAVKKATTKVDDDDDVIVRNEKEEPSDVCVIDGDQNKTPPPSELVKKRKAEEGETEADGSDDLIILEEDDESTSRKKFKPKDDDDEDVIVL